MGYFPVRYDSRVVIYNCKMFITLATARYAKAVKLLGVTITDRIGTSHKTNTYLVRCTSYFGFIEPGRRFRNEL